MTSSPSETKWMPTRRTPARHAARPLGAALLLLLLMGGPKAYAQDESNEQALPDIAPRVVEIKGQLEISLPSLRRQPLTGFNPPPRVVGVPSDRRPYVAGYKQRKEDLPGSGLTTPRVPEVTALRSLPAHQGALEADAGRYYSRLVRLRIEAPMTATEAAYARLDYRGSAGDEPFTATPDAASVYDAIRFDAGFQTHRRAFALGLDGNGFFDAYDLYGAVASSVALKAIPNRQRRGGGASLWFATREAVPFNFDVRLRYLASRVATDALPSGPGSDTFDQLERRLSGTSHLAFALAPGQEFRADAGFATAGLDDEALVGNTVAHFDGGAGLFLRGRSGFDARVGARFITFATQVQRPDLADDGSADGTYVALDGRLNLYPSNRLNLYLQNRPGATMDGLAAIEARNPYLIDHPVVQPEIRTINAEGGARLFAGPVSLSGHAGFERAQNYLFFDAATTQESGGYVLGFSAARYAPAEIVRFGGDVGVVVTRGLSASLGVSVRNGTLTDTDEDIPNFADVEGRGMVSFSFDESRGLFQLHGRYLSTRFRDRAKTRKLGDFFDLDAELTYDLSPGLGMVLRAENLSRGPNLERWDRYEQTPVVVMAGFRLLW